MIEFNSFCDSDTENRDGKETSLLGFGSVPDLVKYLTTGFGFCDYHGTVRFGSKMSVFLHCKFAYTTEENICFALLNRIMC